MCQAPFLDDPSKKKIKKVQGQSKLAWRQSRLKEFLIPTDFWAPRRNIYQQVLLVWLLSNMLLPKEQRWRLRPWSRSRNWSPWNKEGPEGQSVALPNGNQERRNSLQNPKRNPKAKYTEDTYRRTDQPPRQEACVIIQANVVSIQQNHVSLIFTQVEAIGTFYS